MALISGRRLFEGGIYSRNYGNFMDNFVIFGFLFNYIVYAKTVIHEHWFFESLHGEKIYKLDFVVTPHNFIIAKL